MYSGDGHVSSARSNTSENFSSCQGKSLTGPDSESLTVDVKWNGCGIHDDSDDCQNNAHVAYVGRGKPGADGEGEAEAPQVSYYDNSNKCFNGNGAITVDNIACAKLIPR